VTEWIPTSLDFLQAVYRNEELPLSVRMRAATAAIPYEHARLAVVAQLHAGWAADLEAMMTRSGKSPVIGIEAKAIAAPAEGDSDS
jgi:hypothetical protein